MDRNKVNSLLAYGENHKGPLRIEKSGRKISQEVVFDLKKRTGWKKDLNMLENGLLRYSVAQTPKSILTRYDGGVFDDINVQQVRNDVQT